MKVKPNDISSGLYHSVLRAALLVTTFILVFVSGILDSSTQTLTLLTQNQLANVIEITSTQGVDTQYRNQPIITTINSEAQVLNKNTFFMATVLFILLLLTILNYVLYYLRHREATVTLFKF